MRTPQSASAASSASTRKKLPEGFAAPPPTLQGVLLDVDGTLLDSNDAQAHAWAEALLGEGIALPVDQIRRRIGLGGEKLLWELVNLPSESDVAQTVVRHRAEIFKTRYLPEVAAFAGTRELLARMRAGGLSLHIATSSSSEEVNDLLTSAGVIDLVQGGVTKADASRAKPDPDVVRAALARSGLDADRVVMLGDTPCDIECGHRAGVRVLALRCGGWDDDALRGALAIYDDPSDLLSRWDDSVFAAESRAKMPAG